MPQYALTSVPYVPSSPLTGEESIHISRGANMILRGYAPNLFYEAYAGSENLGEYLPADLITGTLAFSPASLTVTGDSTLFLEEVFVGQFLLANTEVLVVAKINSNTEFITSRFPLTTETVATATRLRNLFALNTQRGSLLHGNAVHFDKGTLMAVGSGELYVNGAVLPGTSLTGLRQPRLALYDGTSGTYSVVPVGFAVTPNVVYGNVSINASGGVKSMAHAKYGLRVGYYSDVTGGYSNPCDTLLAGGTTGFDITVDNSTFTIDFTTDQARVDLPTNATGYVIYGSAFSGSATTAAVNAIEGGWFEVKRVKFADLIAHACTFEYVDTDLGNLVSFDNDAPPDAEWVANLTGYAALVSTNGKGLNMLGREKETSPGPYVAPMKADNVDGYPNIFKTPTEKGETIIGMVSAAGRIFVLTPNSLQAVTPTGLPSAPFTTRPFWMRGFKGPYNLCFVDDVLYGFTTAGMFRSIATGDQGAESHTFAADVETVTAEWNGAYVFVERDLKNEQVCFFHSASRQNDDGYWESDVLPYSLRQQQWMPPIILSDPDRDMIVSGVASVAGHLEFVAGGRRRGTTNRHDTWRFDTGSGVDVPYYLAYNFSDVGAEMTAKTIRKLRPKGKFTNAKVQIYNATANTNIDITDLETGTNSAYEYLLSDSPVVKQYGIQKCRVRNGMMFTARIEGTANWDGVSEKDQFHELAIELDIAGQMR
jgi:hypothetical protein